MYDTLAIVRADTVIRWHRAGFRLFGAGARDAEAWMSALIDSVGKVLCGAYAYFTTGAVDAVRHGGPRQSTLDRSAIILALL